MRRNPFGIGGDRAGWNRAGRAGEKLSREVLALERRIAAAGAKQEEIAADRAQKVAEIFVERHVILNGTVLLISKKFTSKPKEEGGYTRTLRPNWHTVNRLDLLESLQESVSSKAVIVDACEVVFDGNPANQAAPLWRPQPFTDSFALAVTLPDPGGRDGLFITHVNMPPVHKLRDPRANTIAEFFLNYTGAQLEFIN